MRKLSLPLRKMGKIATQGSSIFFSDEKKVPFIELSLGNGDFVPYPMSINIQSFIFVAIRGKRAEKSEWKRISIGSFFDSYYDDGRLSRGTPRIGTWITPSLNCCLSDRVTAFQHSLRSDTSSRNVSTKNVPSAFVREKEKIIQRDI